MGEMFSSIVNKNNSMPQPTQQHHDQWQPVFNTSHTQHIPAQSQSATNVKATEQQEPYSFLKDLTTLD